MADDAEAVEPDLGWYTTIGRNGLAHYYIHGRPSCSERRGVPEDVPINQTFSRPKRVTRDEDHLCHYCVLVFARECECWRCKMKREGGLRG